MTSRIIETILFFFIVSILLSVKCAGSNWYYSVTKANFGIGQGSVYVAGNGSNPNQNSAKNETKYRTVDSNEKYDASGSTSSEDTELQFDFYAKNGSNPRFNFLGWSENKTGPLIECSQCKLNDNGDYIWTTTLTKEQLDGVEYASVQYRYAIFSAYYARAHAVKSTSNSGGGKVCISSSNLADPTEYVDSYDTGSGNYYTSTPGGMIDFGYFAKPDNNSIFLGWSLDGDIDNIVAGSDQYVNDAYKWVHRFAASTEYCIGNNDTECKDPNKNKELDQYYAYAHFTAKYTITYSGEGISFTPQVYWTENKTVVLPLPSRSGFIFAGWKVKSNTGSWTQTSYPGGFPVSGMTGDVTLEAQWSQPCKVTVSVSGIEGSDVALFEISGGQFYRFASGNGNTVFSALAIGDLVKPGEWNKKYEFTPQSLTVESTTQTLTFTAHRTDNVSSEDHRTVQVD